jgi:ABC-type lipoprotein export system ATPase subunit
MIFYVYSTIYQVLSAKAIIIFENSIFLTSEPTENLGPTNLEPHNKKQIFKILKKYMELS